MYQTTIDKFGTKYIYPQENGNRSDVKWASLTNVFGMGLLVSSLDTFNFSVHRNTVEEIDTAQHTYDLDDRDEIYLHIDHKQHGIGTASCGPDVLPAHELKNEDFKFGYRLTPFSLGQISPVQLSKRTLE